MDNPVDNFGPDGGADTDSAGPVDAGGEPAAADAADLARSVLDGARRMADGPGRRRGGAGARRRNRRENLAGRGGRNRGGYSAAGPDAERDPVRLGRLLSGLVNDQGWERPLAEARVFSDWDSLVGGDVAAHAHPQQLHDGELRVAAESTAWATQLRLLAGTLVARLTAELGPGVVTRLVITGPVAPSWRHGGRTVRGARGPRDTYG